MLLAFLFSLSPAIDAPPPRPAPLVARNAIVTMEFQRGPLVITAQGRAMGAGGLGEPVRVMNMSSRVTVDMRVIGPGRVAVP